MVARRADGADTVVTRVVRAADDTLLWEDFMRTHYLPWQAVYQYGPGAVLPEGALVEPTPTP
ncbi:MAG: hypothetical protein AAB427_07290 [Chloroflexota bacterium]